MAAIEGDAWVDQWVSHEAFGDPKSARAYGEILLRRVLRIELPIDKSEREKLAVAALQAATWVQAKHGSGSQWNPTLLREAFRRRRIFDGEHLPTTVGDEFIKRRNQYVERQANRHGWLYGQDVRHVFAFAIRGLANPGQRTAMLNILLQTSPADAADEKARQRVRRLFEQVPTEELEAMWNDIRLETLEAEVSELRTNNTAMQNALLDAVADLGRRMMTLEQGDELPDWQALMGASDMSGL